MNAVLKRFLSFHSRHEQTMTMSTGLLTQSQSIQHNKQFEIERGLWLVILNISREIKFNWKTFNSPVHSIHYNNHHFCLPSISLLSLSDVYFCYRQSFYSTVLHFKCMQLTHLTSLLPTQHNSFFLPCLLLSPCWSSLV